MEINIYNSFLPYTDRYLKSICRPLAKKAKIKKNIVVDFWEISYKKIYNGGSPNIQVGYAYCNNTAFWIDCNIDQKLTYPYVISNISTLKTMGKMTLYSQEDLIKFIIAHEFCHATYGNPDNFKLPMGGVDTHAMELCCDSFALAATGIKN